MKDEKITAMRNGGLMPKQFAATLNSGLSKTILPPVEKNNIENAKSEITKIHRLLVLFLEALGVWCLTTVYLNLTLPLFQKNWTRWKNLLCWFLYAIVSTLIMYAIRKNRGNWSLKDLGFRVHKDWKNDIGFGIILTALFYLLNIPLLIFGLRSLSEMFSDFQLLEYSLPIALIIFTGQVLATGFFTGALHEEIRFRGYLQGLFSEDYAPAIGFFISLIPFSFGHYFTHPEWNILQVINTIMPGAIFCLAYYATGSLIVCITVHTLINVVNCYVPFVYARGDITSSYFLLISLALLSMFVLIIGRKKFFFFLEKVKELFISSGWFAGITGFILGIIFLVFNGEKNLLPSQLGLSSFKYNALLLSVGLILILAPYKFSKKKIDLK